MTPGADPEPQSYPRPAAARGHDMDVPPSIPLSVMENNIHPTAVIDPRATIGRHVCIGPFCVVEAGAIVGDGCRLASRVVVKEHTSLGERNDVDEGTCPGRQAPTRRTPRAVGETGHRRGKHDSRKRHDSPGHVARQGNRRGRRQPDHGQCAHRARLPGGKPHDPDEQRHAGRPRDGGRLRLSFRGRGSASVLPHWQSLHGGWSIAHQQGCSALRDRRRSLDAHCRD